MVIRKLQSRPTQSTQPVTPSSEKKHFRKQKAKHSSLQLSNEQSARRYDYVLTLLWTLCCGSLWDSSAWHQSWPPWLHRMGGEQSGCTSQSLAPRALGPLLPAGCCWRTWGDSRYHPWAAGTAHQCLHKVMSQRLSGWPKRRQLHSSLEYLWPQSLIELEWAYYIVTMLRYTSSFSTNSMLSQTATCILIKHTLFIT